MYLQDILYYYLYRKRLDSYYDIETDGLSTLKYKVVKRVCSRLYTRIIVDLVA